MSKRRFRMAITVDHADDSVLLTTRIAQAYREYADHIEADLDTGSQYNFVSSDKVELYVTEIP